MMGKFDDIPVFNKFADLPDEPVVPAKFAEFSISWVIQWFIDEMNGTEGKRAVKPLGPSHYYTLRRFQSSPIGKIDARNLTEDDVIDHCKLRLEKVAAPTINQDVGYLNGALKYVKAARRDCKEIKAGVIKDVRPFLFKNGYIGKSDPRTRLPTDEEIAKLLERAAKPLNRKNKTVIYAMPDILAFKLVSARRIGEVCRITHSDVEWDHKDDAGNPAPIYWVRDMKHPTKKKGNDSAFTLFPELAEIIRRQPRKEGDDRIFPFNSKSVTAKFIRLKKDLGIEGLHLHDFRGEAITNWLKKLTPQKVRKFVSGHKTSAIFDRVYDRTDPADGHDALRQSAL
jgi:integrase